MTYKRVLFLNIGETDFEKNIIGNEYVEPLNMKSLPGAFVDWDNTLRKGKFGTVFNGASPIKFREYFARQVERAEKVYNKDMIFLFAWNEWSEEGYLEAVRDVMNTYTRW